MMLMMTEGMELNLLSGREIYTIFYQHRRYLQVQTLVVVLQELIKKCFDSNFN